ncbi:antibiotic biosynthesis monooxygenase [Bacillus sp. FJAT-42376]|uniref:putative quinol monooxygenase n=1 Tax=Bacillus sp. FJAT-42376 TaxID=2014076 RepID=UPI000F4F52D0|nr:antibiotic biosynthesis monooxygenase [Bacillus sp. FJAT-42376]AZB41572.1 antibiotic biosynthesis monooxygenase [Bacillus sp. FJAT-42376]
MEKFGLFGKILAKEGQGGQLAAILLEAAEAMKEVQGCELYVVSTAQNEPDAVMVYEVWKSEEAHQASLTLESTQNLIKQAKPIMAGMERISTLKPLGGKGL